MSSTVLPSSNYVSVTWGIRTDSGGLTVTLLHRAGIMSQAGAGHVTVLTFDNFPDYDQVEVELRKMGRLFGDVSIRNLWDWLRTEQIPVRSTGPSTALDKAFTPIADSDSYESTFRGGKEISRTRYAADDVTVLQVDHFREDGTLMLSDRRDFRERGVRGGRRIILCDSEGTPYKMWKVANEFYHWLLDRMFGKTPTTYIVDSKTAVGMFVEYRRRTALKASPPAAYPGRSPAWRRARRPRVRRRSGVRSRLRPAAGPATRAAAPGPRTAPPCRTR